MADRTETIVLDFEIDESDSVQSIESITKASKALREERAKLNLQSAEGQKRVKEINAQLDANNSKIKENVSALEKQRINVGNYKSALDGVHPALGKLGQGLEAGTQGFKAMTLQALRFIATPIGAILAAIVTVFTLLKTAVSQNNELLDKFENITNAVGTVLQVIIGRVGKLGEALIALATGNFDKALNLTAQAFGGLAEEIGNAVTQSQLYLDLSRDLEDSQRALRIETAKAENEIKRLVVAAKNRNLTFDEQEELLRKALTLEEQLVQKRAENAQKDLVITAKRIALDRQLSQTQEETFDEFVNRLVESSKLGDAQVDEIVDKIEALEQARGSSLAFQEKLENSLSAIQEKRAAALEKQNAALRDQEALERATRRAQNVSDTSVEDPLVGAFKTRAKVIEDLDKRIQRDTLARDKETKDQQFANEQKLTALKAQQQHERLQQLNDSANDAAIIFGRESAAYKAIASAQTLIATYSSAQKAFDSLAGIPIVGPTLGGVAAALAVAAGLARVAQINGVEFAEGGYTGPGGKYEYAGKVHKGEVVWNQEDVAKVGGPAAANAMRPTYGLRQGVGGNHWDGGLVTNSISQPINQQLEIVNIVKNLPPVVASWSEGKKVGRRLEFKEKISKR